MHIYKAVFFTAMGIAVIIFGVYLWSWKQPENAAAYGNLTSEEAAGIIKKGRSDNKLAIIDSNLNSVQAFDSAWNKLNPDLVLVEGSLGFFLPGVMDPVKKFGIEGRARELALKRNLMLYSYRLDDKTITSELMKKYSKEQVALTMLLDSYYSGMAADKNISPENIIRECIHKSRCGGFDAGFKSAREIDIIWVRDFGNSADWRYAERLTGYAGTIAAEIKLMKKKHLQLLIASFLSSGKKVLAVDNLGIFN